MSGGGGITGNSFLDMGVMVGASILAPELAPVFMEEGALSMGLGEAAASGVAGAGLGAIGGGVTSAMTGRDPLQGALMGGIGGGIGGYGKAGGFSGMFGSGATPTEELTGLTSAPGGGVTAAAPTPAGPQIAGNAVNPGFVNPGLEPEVGLSPAQQLQNQYVAQDIENGANAGIGRGTTSTAANTPSPGADKSWWSGLNNYQKAATVGAGGLATAYLMNQDSKKYGIPSNATTPYTGGNLSKFKYDPNQYTPDAVQPPRPPYQANYAGYARPPGYADGGYLNPNSGNVDFMGGDMYPQSQQQRSYYATPTQAPTSAQQAMASYEPKTNPLTGAPTVNMAVGGLASITPPGQFANPVNDYSSMYFDPQTGQYISKQQNELDTANLAALKASQDQLAAQQDASGGGGGAGGDGGAGDGGGGGDGGGSGDARGGYYSRNRFDYHPAKMAGGGSGIDALRDLMGSRDAIQKYKSQHSKDPKAVLSKAQGGDYNAMLAMNQLRGTPNANYASGGISSLGGYSDGGRMLKGPGDGMSDSIPATIKGKQPARLADNEFVVPADVVSHLGNGSSDAGAKKLYAMMNKVRKARTGKAKQAPAISADKYMPA